MNAETYEQMYEELSKHPKETLEKFGATLRMLVEGEMNKPIATREGPLFIHLYHTRSGEIGIKVNSKIVQTWNILEKNKPKPLKK
jgi:hypothetical protein